MPMTGKAAILVLALGLALAQPKPSSPAPAKVSLPPAAEKVARRFLEAFAANDRAALKDMLPRQPSNLYGPSPFAGMPTLRKPRADGRVAAIDFEGRMTDPGLPRRGLILLRYVEEDGVRAWRVRQIYWYDELPPEADIPDQSATAEDRQQEPNVRRAATEFLSAWLDGDYQRMDRLTFHWWEVPRRPPKWVSFAGAELEARGTTLSDLRIDFRVKLRALGLLPKSVHGNLWMVQEEGVWRVRPLTFALWF
jgi:hypothetical protein